MKRDEQLTQIRAVLADLYPTEADLRRVAHDAGVPIARVSLQESALNNWDGLLREAAKNLQVADLLDVALQEYPQNPQLKAFLATVQAAPPPSATPLPDRGLVLLNFGRALTPAQRQQIEERLQERLHLVVDLNKRFEDERPYGPQCVELLDGLAWSPGEWETRPLLVIPPGFAPAALALISLIHGRRGHFPAMARLRSETAGLQPTFVLGEIVNLQALRNAAHGRR